MKVELFVLRKGIFYLLFWWNISRNMTSDTSLFRVLPSQIKTYSIFLYLCWLNYQKPRQSLHVLLLKKFRVCRTFFCFFNFCPKILNTLHQIYNTFQIFEEILKYSQSLDIFWGQTTRRRLKTVDVLWKLNCLCCGNVFFIFCFDAIFHEIWRQIQAYFEFCFTNQNMRNFPIPVLVALTDAKTISSCFTIEEVHKLPNLLFLF